MQNHIQQRLVYADAPVVFNEAVLTKTIHKETDARPGGPNHLRQSLLSDIRNQRLRFTGLATGVSQEPTGFGPS